MHPLYILYFKMIYNIFTGLETEVLRTKSKKIDNFNSALKKLEKDMIKTMLHANGVGLAAPQIGKNIRFLVAKINDKTTISMANPEVVKESSEEEWGEEGCLSLPGLWGKVKRSKSITVRFQSINGRVQTLKLTDFAARVIQHEIDHINGVLFADRAIDLETEEHIPSDAYNL